SRLALLVRRGCWLLPTDSRLACRASTVRRITPVSSMATTACRDDRGYIRAARHPPAGAGGGEFRRGHRIRGHATPLRSRLPGGGYFRRSPWGRSASRYA